MAQGETKAARSMDKSGLRASAVAVLYALASLLRDGQAEEVPMQKVMQMTGVSDATARRSIKTLEGAGVLRTRPTGRALEITLTLSEV